MDPKQYIECLIHMEAAPYGFGERTVRLNGGRVALCTATYNFAQDEYTRAQVARRLAALWNLARGVPTETLERVGREALRDE